MRKISNTPDGLSSEIEKADRFPLSIVYLPRVGPAWMRKTWTKKYQADKLACFFSTADLSRLRYYRHRSSLQAMISNFLGSIVIHWTFNCCALLPKYLKPGPLAVPSCRAGSYELKAYGAILSPGLFVGCSFQVFPAPDLELLKVWSSSSRLP